MAASSPNPGLVAYFSPEFGLGEALPQYAGGLGILAGDHLKAAADAGVPLVGVGLFYRYGYFRQSVSPTGAEQVDSGDEVDPLAVGLEDAGRARVDVAGRPVGLRIWRRAVGSVDLYLLDSDVEENDPPERAITDRLYGGGGEHRIRQEIVLGMGGMRALDALGIDPAAFHLNEGHAGFLVLERIRREVEASGCSIDEAVERIRPSTLFTTHTPVPAGIDRFPRALFDRYFHRFAEGFGASTRELMRLGAMPGEDDTFNMAAFCLRAAGHANGVSELHGRVSRRMFAPLWPGSSAEGVPIGSVTNGVHALTWTAPEMVALFQREVGSEWNDAPVEAWAGVERIGDDEIRKARSDAKQRLASTVRERSATGDGEFDPDVLTVGFARRFATYKRAGLLLSDPDRLRRLLLDADRPVQILVAGKAHRDDGAGRDLLATVLEAATDPSFKGRFVFLLDYDMAVARALVEGCDVWLNTPIRGLEASGTSGEKAALNGGLNCSILDGWWSEMYDGENGWAIPSSDAGDPAGRDREEADAAFRVLEEEVVPLFYGTRSPPFPSAEWLARVRAAWKSLGPRVTAARMIHDYVDQYYRPATAAGPSPT